MATRKQGSHEAATSTTEAEVRDLNLIDAIPTNELNRYNFEKMVFITPSGSALFFHKGTYKTDPDRVRLITPDIINICRELSIATSLAPTPRYHAIENTVSAIFSVDSLETLTKVVACIPKVSFLDRAGELDLSLLIAYIQWVPGMEDVGMYYCIRKDDAVTEITSTSVTNKYMNNLPADKDPSTNRLVQRHTTGEMKCIGYVLLLMSVKTLSKEYQTHLHDYLTRRLGAFTHVLGVEAKSITWSLLSQKFTQDQLEVLANQVSYFPCLLQALFNPIISRATAETQHMASIFEDTAITIFAVIYEFMSTTSFTRLHTHAPLFAQMRSWIVTIKEIQNKYGNTWKFYKLLEPSSDRTSHKQFPTLGCAALSWKKSVSDGTVKATLNNIRTLKTSQLFEDLAGKPIDTTFVGSAKDVYVTELGKMKKSGFISLNWDSIIQAVNTGKWVEGVDF